MKLPEIFKNKINNDIKEKTFIGKSEKKESLEEYLKDLPTTLIITTNKYTEEPLTIVGRTKNYIITKTRDVIFIKDIKNIKKPN